MANTIIPKRSSVAGKVPLSTDLQIGEIAVNLADGLIFTKNAGGTVISLGGGGGTLTASAITSALGYTPANKAGETFTGKVVLPAATTSIASLNAPHGTAPSAPVNGDIWTTTAALFARINGVTQQVATLATAQTWTANQTFSNPIYANSDVYLDSSSAGLIRIGNNLGAGNILIGSSTQWGGITLGQSTDTHTLNIDSGATASGKTKTINIGANGVSGSTTVINLGSSVSGATSTINTYGTWNYNGKVVLPAVSAANAPLNIGQAAAGTNPSSPSNGDMWVNAWGLFARYNGGTHQFAAYDISANWSALQAFDGGMTTGNITASGANVYLGQSTGLSYAYLGTGATVSGQIKDVRVGTGGASGSTTNITLGSSVSGSTTTVASYGTWTHNGSFSATNLSLSSSQVTTALGYTPYNAGANTVITSANVATYLDDGTY